MPRLTTAFAVEIFDQRNAGSKRLAMFMSVYVRHFGSEHRTRSNELIDFLARPPSDRKIVYFGLTYREIPCGFATLMIYPSGPIAIIDHLVIAPNARGYGGFFEFCNLIEEYIDQSAFQIEHLIAEVVAEESDVAATLKPTHLLRMMRFVGFKVAKVRYWAPDPLIVRDPDRTRALLLFISRPERDTISRDNLLRVLKIIYETHYVAWYERTMNAAEFSVYRDKALELLQAIRNSLEKQKTIKLNGLRSFDLSIPSEASAPLRPSNVFYVATIALPATVGLAVGFAQERWVTASAAFATATLIAVFAANKRLRAILRRAFQVGE